MSQRPIGAEFWSEPFRPITSSSSYMTRFLYRVVGHSVLFRFAGDTVGEPGETIVPIRMQEAPITGIEFDGSPLGKPIYGEWEDSQ